MGLEGENQRQGPRSLFSSQSALRVTGARKSSAPAPGRAAQMQFSAASAREKETSSAAHRKNRPFELAPLLCRPQEGECRQRGSGGPWGTSTPQLLARHRPAARCTTESPWQRSFSHSPLSVLLFILLFPGKQKSLETSCFSRRIFSASAF